MRGHSSICKEGKPEAPKELETNQLATNMKQCSGDGHELPIYQVC